jgi:NADPH2:quinone reductase
MINAVFAKLWALQKPLTIKKKTLASVIEDITGGRGVDVLLDMIGGDYTAGNIKSLAVEGRLVLINAMNGNNVQIDLAQVMQKRLVITGSTLRSREVGFKGAIAHKLKAVVWPLLVSGDIRPVIHSVFPASEAAEAHRLMESSGHIGKIMLDFGD